jgi:hypothetical protein
MASVAHAAPEGVGGFELLGGWRLTPNGYFANTAAQVGTPLTHASPGGPVAIASFSYVPLSWLAIAVDGMVGGERLYLKGEPVLTSVTYGAMIGPKLVPDLGHGFTLTLGVSTGAILVNESGLHLPQADEQLDQAFMGEVGVMWEFAPNIQLCAEYRLLLARGYVPGYSGINGGGSWFGVGLNFWIAAAEPTHVNF